MQKRKRISRPRLVCALIFNALLVAAGGYSVYLNIVEVGARSFVYFTALSNAAALAVSALFVIFASVALAHGTRVPLAVSVLRYITACSLAVTFVVVVAVLAPQYGYYETFVPGSRLFQHAVCPAVSLVSLLFFEKQNGLRFRHTWLALAPVVAYGGVTAALNFAGKLRGPYPFLLVTENTPAESVFWAAVITGGTYVIALCVYFIAKDKKPRLHFS